MEKESDMLTCKFCGSDNVVVKKQTGYAVMLSVMLLGLPLPVFKKTYYCFDCDKEWKIKEK
jgi:hypothetical protein